VFVPVKTSQSRFVFVGDARSLTLRERQKGTPLGQARALLGNTRLGWKVAATLSITTFSITTLNIKGLFVTLSIDDIKHN
jgi:hypothetical protein